MVDRGDEDLALRYVPKADPGSVHEEGVPIYGRR